MIGPDVRRTTKGGGGAVGGVACPDCGARIEISLDDLLIRHAFRCVAPGCGLILRLDQRGSSQALGTLRALRNRLREIGGETG